MLDVSIIIDYFFLEFDKKMPYLSIYCSEFLPSLFFHNCLLFGVRKKIIDTKERRQMPRRAFFKITELKELKREKRVKIL